MIVLCTVIVLSLLAVAILAFRIAPSNGWVSPRRRQRAVQRTTFRAEDHIDQVISGAIDEMLQTARLGRSGRRDTSDRH